MSGSRNLLSGLAAAVAMTIAVSAQAQTSSPAPSMSQALRQALGVSGQSSTLPMSYAGAETPLTPGVGRTAVDHSFGKGGGVTGSAGFLCGRGAGPDNNGAATAYGYDPEGRFVGAKLSIAFK
jgi:hypothetical protein